MQSTNTEKGFSLVSALFLLVLLSAGAVQIGSLSVKAAITAEKSYLNAQLRILARSAADYGAAIVSEGEICNREAIATPMPPAATSQQITMHAYCELPADERWSAKAVVVTGSASALYRGKTVTQHYSQKYTFSKETRE